MGRRGYEKILLVGMGVKLGLTCVFVGGGDIVLGLNFEKGVCLCR